MIALLVALAFQPKTASVGDTVWVAIRVVVPAGQILRPQTWDLADLGQALGPPEVSYEADSATIRYPVVFWYPGDHPVTLPGPIVVTTAGRSDTLPAKTMTIAVGSVLPAGKAKRELAPRDPAPMVAQAGRSWLPLVLLLGLAASGLGLVWWRSARRARRRRATLSPAMVAPEPDVAGRLTEWAALGEGRTALDGWAHLIERDLERHPDPAKVASAGPLLDRMAVAGFDREGPVEAVDGLLEEAAGWVGRGG